MVFNIYREKLVNSILYFARETSHLNMTKLFKLLNFFDFEHFSETGYPAIGLHYETFERGPVPRQLWLDVKDAHAPADVGKLVVLVENRRDYDKDWREIEFKPRAGATLRWKANPVRVLSSGYTSRESASRPRATPSRTVHVICRSAARLYSSSRMSRY